ncbi:polysaccharide biosynthesis protein [Rasiella rasia]|uniref:polysaccharide biosynthesis protein n=1 Tax=Rasiella rasia TaxID=2744027 RepID=UPI001583FCB0|nr:nucleoside-diphosphate sugar epimerase/dehydratase [Rasiella rasia]
MNKSSKILSKLFVGDNKLRLLDQRYLPRWIVVLIDVLLCGLALAVSYFILSDTRIAFHDVLSVPEQMLVILAVNLTFFFVFKSYSGIIRHSTFIDIVKLAFTSISTAVIVLLGNEIFAALEDQKIFLTTFMLLYMFTSFTFMLFFRISVKESYTFLRNAAHSESKKKIAIIGIDDPTVSLAKAIVTESELPYTLVGFLTQNTSTKRVQILGKPVISSSNLSESLNKLEAEAVLLMSDSFSGREKNEIVESCLNAGVEILNVPNLQNWKKKEDISNQIKPLEIEDLLERSPIRLDDTVLANDLKGKTVLVTGGAGSIGSEIVQQLATFKPALVVILDQAESALHELELSLRLNYPDFNFITELADISNMYRLELMFKKYNFNIIYHAAAYKHVPLIERNPHEAIYVNLLGTINLCFQSVSNKIDRFVMVSTDKAVNPTNVMGASKRAAEMYVQALQQEPETTTKFITTRFGNVLGSNGSVIPHFKKQIAQGGPVTVTHKDIIRYFMTIPEACQLVMQAGTMGKGGEIYVFDMGEPVKIIDLAKRMIRLSGLEPYEDIDIKITGLRPGEKLYEELLNDTNVVLPTHHPKIMISSVPSVAFSEIKAKSEEIIRTATKRDDESVVALLKEIVPEFRSQNSTFERLDKPKNKALTKI